MRGCGCCLLVSILCCFLFIECKVDVQLDADCLIEWVPVIIYGWLVHHRVNLAAPLFFGEYSSLAEILPFFGRNLIISMTIVGYGQMGISQTCQVLLLDLYPGNGASIIAILILYVGGMARVRRFILSLKAIKIGPTLVRTTFCVNTLFGC